MGVQLAAVQRILRHSSITVTIGTYVEVNRPKRAHELAHLRVKQVELPGIETA